MKWNLLRILPNEVDPQVWFESRRSALQKYKIILFSIEGAGPDFVLHGDELAAPDHNVPAVPAHHRGLRLYPPGLRLV